MLYRNFVTQEQIDEEYNPLISARDASSVVDGWAKKSRRARETLDCKLRMRYGPTKEEYIDLFPAEDSGAPLHLFIHGGYWRKGIADDFSFIARDLVASGVSVGVMNYSLCPSVKLAEIVRQTRAAVYWLATNKVELACGLGNLSISGHSAGGHLVSMALATRWVEDYGLEENPIKGACAISGVFDLAPLPYSFLQPKLQLDMGDVRDLSPIYHLPKEAPNLAVVVGSEETSEFIRQSRDFFDLWTASGLDGKWLEVPSVHHFNILNGLEDKDSDLFQSILSIARDS